MKKAFTLIELLISIIIILIITASLIPIITKKVTKPVKVSSQTKTIDPQGEVFIPFDGSSETSGKYFKCEKAQENSLTCAIKNIPSPTVNVILAAGGGGGAGATRANFGAVTSNTYSSKENYTISTAKLYNVKINLYSAGGSGGGAVYKETDKNKVSYIDDCPEGSILVKTGSEEEYCVTKYNVRPASYDDYHINNKNTKEPENDATAREIKTSADMVFDTTSTYSTLNSSKLPACWISDTTSCTNGSGDYPACGRTVCNWWAANIMCGALNLGGNNCKDNEGNLVSCKGKWRLATANELNYGSSETSTGFLNGIFYNDFAGLNGNPAKSLQLCSRTSSHLPYCNYVSYGKCYGGYYNQNNLCLPYYFWGENYNTSYGIIGYITSSYSYTSQGQAYNASVRCVLSKTRNTSKIIVNTGGSGGGGASVENLKVPQSLIEDCNVNNKNCKFVLNAKNTEGGKGKRIENEDSEEFNTDGNDGYSPSIELVTGDGKILWGYKVEGGKKGTGATLNAAGKGGEKGALCYKHDGTKWSAGYLCTEETEGRGYIGKPGKDGQSAEYTIGEEYVTLSTSTGGYGGAGSYSKGGDGGNFVNKSTSLTGNGGDTISYIKFQGSRLHKGASGGGGGGGSFAQIENIFIGQNKGWFDVYIGGGGKGGRAQIGNASSVNETNSATNGEDGSNTSIYTGNNLYYTTEGGKGGKIGKTADPWGKYEREFGLGGTGGKIIPGMYKTNSSIKTVDGADGNAGINGSINLMDGIGGLGGRSGISVLKEIIQYSQGCGGFFVDTAIGCDNQNNENGLSTTFLSSKHPKFDLKNGQYGSYGAGGGGGGWSINPSTGEKSGNGAAGQGGYIYIWW